MSDSSDFDKVLLQLSPKVNKLTMSEKTKHSLMGFWHLAALFVKPFVIVFLYFATSPLPNVGGEKGQDILCGRVLHFTILDSIFFFFYLDVRLDELPRIEASSTMFCMRPVLM